MKFIGFFEYKAEDIDKVIEKFKLLTAEREKGITKFAKVILGPLNFTGETKGFTVFETDDPDTLMNTALFYIPVLNYKFIPIQESSRGVELWAKMKKG